jgi:ABC-type multidrug transport system fused ATPase/permease subunit
LSLINPVRRSLRLLNRRDRRLLFVATLIQVSTSVLDLVGLLLIGLVAGMSMAVLTGTTPPEFVDAITTRFLPEGTSLGVAAVWVGAAAAVILMIKTFTSMWLTRRVLRFLARRQAMVSGRLVEALLSKPLLQLQLRSSQQTAFALTGGVNNAILVVLGQGSVAVSESALLVVVTVGLLAVDPMLTLFAFMFFAVVGLVLYRILSGWAVRLGTQFANLDIESYVSIQEAILTYRELTVSGRRAAYVDKVQLLRWRAAAVTSDMQFIGLVPKYVFEVALVVGASLLAVSQFITKDATAAVAVIAVYLVAGIRVVPSLLRMQGAVLSVRSAGATASPTYELAGEIFGNEGEEAGDAREPIDFSELTSSIRQGYPGFQSRIDVVEVEITYPGTSTPAIEHVSVSIPEGRSLALVGSTGAGKSTLVDVILGVLEPSAGHVSIGGLPPAAAIAKWPGAISYVPQAIALTNGTVSENVALGLPDADIDEDLVWEALDRAHLSDFLREGREGLRTRIGEGGVMLSGGQRQRLGIARALYTRPRLLVLDEATSALDAETEQAIAGTLRSLEGSVTTVTIAHRLATIRHCDIVMYLEGGRVRAIGTFEEIRAQSSHFDAQARLLGLE